MTKLHRILIGILAAQLVLAMIVFWPRPAASGAGTPLLDIKVEDITGMTVTDDQGAVVKLTKPAANWVAPGAGDYPVDAAKVTPVLTKLVALTAGQAVAQTAASQAQLQVADDKFVRKIELQTANAVKTLFLGSSAGSQATHVRVSGQDAVYLGRGVTTWEISADLLSWIDPVYLAVPAADLAAFTLQNANGSFAFTKDATGNWALDGLAAGETLNANSITTLVSQVASLRMTVPLGKTNDPAYGLAQPTALLTLQARSGDQAKTITLAVGAQNPADRSYVVKSSESAYYVRVAEASAQTLVTRARQDFLQQPTPAAPASAPTPAP